MQQYGATSWDQGGARLSVIFELDRKAAPGSLGKTYRDAGFRWDYDAMEHVPWNKIRCWPDARSGRSDRATPGQCAGDGQTEPLGRHVATDRQARQCKRIRRLVCEAFGCREPIEHRGDGGPVWRDRQNRARVRWDRRKLLVRSLFHVPERRRISVISRSSFSSVQRKNRMGHRMWMQGNVAGLGEFALPPTKACGTARGRCHRQHRAAPRSS